MTALVLAVPLAAAPALVAAAEEPGIVTLSKTPSATVVQPGQTFTYTLEVGCTSFGAGCTNAVLTDPVPAGLQVVGTPVVAGGVTGTATVSGQDVTVTFTNPLSDPPGSQGIPTGTTGTVTITVRVDPDLPYAQNGVPIVNTATLDGTNTEPVSTPATVTPSVPLRLAADVTKAFDPAGGLAMPDTTTTATLTATNTSNGPVSSLVVTDPVDPTATPSPFELLTLTGAGPDVTLPEGADQVQVDVYVPGTGWVTGAPGPLPALYPSGVDLDDVTGVRTTFTSTTGQTIVPGGTPASVGVQLAQRPEVADLTATTDVVNTTSATTSHAGATSDPATDDATYEITTGILDVGATKTFSPTGVLAGQPATVTLTGTNASSQTVDSMTFVEPSTTGTTPPFGTDLGFTGFGTLGGGTGVVWPQGATEATVTYTTTDGGSLTFSTTTPNTLPQPPPGTDVARVEVTFTGTIAPGATATVPFGVSTTPGQTADEVEHDNEVAVSTLRDGAAGSAEASATLTTYDARLALAQSKFVSPSSILAVPGETVVVQLPAQLLPFPTSTTTADHIVVQDPTDPTSDAWWNAFDATAITQTAIPDGATLTIRYWDGTQWVVLPGAEDLAGPQVVNIPIPADLQDDVQGLQFDYENPQGFPPSTTVQPNVTMALRDPQRDGTPLENVAQTIQNCAASEAESASAETRSDDACAEVTTVPTVPGEGDLVDKEWVEPTPGAGKTVVARSGGQVDASLRWSTGGYSGLTRVLVDDVQDPPTMAQVSGTVYDAFDLWGVKAITPAMDPWLTYDQVQAVQLWDGTRWADAANDPCPQACDGTFPGVQLTAAERDSTLSVRLVVYESPTRADRIGTDPTLPQPGSGVARSIGNDRDVLLTFQLRDTRRSDGAPALGSTLGTMYNQPGPGEVLNTARVTGFEDSTQVVTSTAGDVVTILDVPLNVDVRKTWSGGPLGIPPAGTDPAAYPSGRVTVVATNATAAKVSRMEIREPATPGGASDPFATFDVKDLVTISVPAGATSTQVQLQHEDGSTTTHSRQEALAFTSADLADVVGVLVVHEGRIAAGATATLTLDARLRATERGTTTPVTAAASPVSNLVEATVSDAGGNVPGAQPVADASATIDLQDLDLSVTTTKQFTPDRIVEPSNGPVTLRLTGRPGGSTRTQTMVLTDDDPQFWNQYDLVGLAPGFTLAAPITRVQVDAFVDATFTGTPGDPAPVAVTGGRWVTGTPTTAASAGLPAGVSPGDVQGLRFTFTRADGAIWENPASPTQTVPLQVARRDTMRTGQPVLSDLAGNAAAPGETAAGVASDTVQAEAISAVPLAGGLYSATAEAEASLLYQHATTAVQIVKAADGAVAGGSQPPGTVFPYTVTVTNTGALPIVDPVIRDVLPTDGSGPLLRFDPDANPGGAGAFAFALSGSAPPTPSGPPLPVVPGDVTTTIDGDVEQLTFAFPPGSVLEVGQTYTITIDLMFRPGLAGGTVVTNTAGVTGERPWDQCDGTLDPATGECQATTDVTVTTNGALRTVKSVKADDPSLGTISVPAGATCTPDADGFYAGPCVPVTAPGGTETWRLQMTNTGNLAQNEVVVIDRLPKPGDTGVVNPLPRGSQWRAPLSGYGELVGAPAGATVALYYTTSDDVCAADLNLGAGAAPCPPGAWTQLTGSEDPSILSTFTAFKIVVSFPQDTFDPLDSFSLDLGTYTPAFAPAGTANPVAWNSTGSAARTVDGGATVRTEGNKVGVAMATGRLQVVKEVTGPGASYAPATFPVQVQCTSAVGTPVEAPVDLGDRGNLVLTEGVPVDVTNLPYGAECTVTEDDGETRPTTFEATTVTVTQEGQEVPVVVATNTYELAGLYVGKTVLSPAEDQDGNPVPYGPFEVTVTCTFLGEEVWADGYGPGTPMVLQIEDGEVVELTGLPARADCTVDETGTAGAVETRMVVTRGDLGPGYVDGTTADVPLLPTLQAGTRNAALIANVFEVGSVEVTKVVDGPGAADFGTGPFEVALVCTLDDASGSRTVWDGTVTLGGGQPLVAQVDDIAAGAVCDVSETGTGGATTVTVSPEQIVVGAGDVAQVTVTNTFELGSVVVDKALDGEGAALYGTGPFEVTLVCTLDGAPVTVPGGAARAFAPGRPAVYDGLPVGADCVVTETGTGAATSTTVSTAGEEGDPGTVVVPLGDDPATLTVTNTFDVGSVQVRKTLSGPDAGAYYDDTFTFALACTLDRDGVVSPVDVPGGATRTVSAATGWSATYDDLPLGAVCQVTETTYGGADVVQVVVQDQVTTTQPSAQALPTSATFRLPVGDDVCVPVDAVNTWDATATSGGAGGGGAGGLGTALVRLPGGLGSLALDALPDGCGPAPFGPPDGASGGGSGLSATGADVLWPALAAALLVLGGGLVLVLARRRRA